MSDNTNPNAHNVEDIGPDFDNPRYSRRFHITLNHDHDRETVILAN